MLEKLLRSDQGEVYLCILLLPSSKRCIWRDRQGRAFHSLKTGCFDIKELKLPNKKHQKTRRKQLWICSQFKDWSFCSETLVICYLMDLDGNGFLFLNQLAIFDSINPARTNHLVIWIKELFLACFNITIKDRINLVKKHKTESTRLRLIFLLEYSNALVYGSNYVFSTRFWKQKTNPPVSSGGT